MPKLGRRLLSTREITHLSRLSWREAHKALQFLWLPPDHATRQRWIAASFALEHYDDNYLGDNHTKLISLEIKKAIKRYLRSYDDEGLDYWWYMRKRPMPAYIQRINKQHYD